MVKIATKILSIKKEIKALRKMILILNDLKKNEENIPTGIRISRVFDRVLIPDISSLEKLHEVRMWLKDTLGHWEDELGSIWFSEGVMIAAFHNNEKEIELWLETKPEDFPSKLKSENCKVVRLPDRIEPDYAYICNWK